MTLQLPSDQLITVPFCGLGTPTDDFVLPPIIGSDSSLVQTQQFGIPPVQQQNPSFGGKPVLRTETNGVLQFYSNVLFFINQGGQFTFDSAQSTTIGGYSTGAVLFNFPTSEYVISLIDNNTFDFVTTPSYIDGVHWKTLKSLAYPDITDAAGLVSIIGSGGLSVTHHAGVGGDLGVIGAITGASISLAAVGGRGSLNAFANGANNTYLGSITSVGGTIDNGLNFNDTVGRPTLNSPATAITSVFELACINDINGAISITQQFIGSGATGGTFTLVATTTNGGFPCATGCNISGSISDGTLAAPNSSIGYGIDLVGNGILSAAPAHSNSGSCCVGSQSLPSAGVGIGAFTVAGVDTMDIIGVNPGYSTGSVVKELVFSINVR